MSRLTEKGELFIKRIEADDLEALAVQVQKTDGPMAVACLRDAAKLIRTLKAAIPEEDDAE